ncbi:MAG: rhomboid family intramembrane serine protease [Saprospiraceae bacterium]
MEPQKSHIFSSLRLPFRFMVLLWGVHFIQIVTGTDFGAYGIYPREMFGLRGILLAPLIHANMQHLVSNSAPLFLLAVMILYFYPRVALRSMAMIYVLTGVAVWLFARKVFHIGASGVIYGLVSFVFWSGIFRRNVKSIILALIVTFLYSGLFLGILPNQRGISWESHLLGGLVGIFTAYWYKEEIEADENPEPAALEGQDEEPSFFLDRDVFEKTKAERLREQQERGF